MEFSRFELDLIRVALIHDMDKLKKDVQADGVNDNIKTAFQVAIDARQKLFDKITLLVVANQMIEG